MALSTMAREGISRTILDVIQSWPEDRQWLFMQIHYNHETTQQVAERFGLSGPEVVQILKRCDRDLFTALRTHRASVETATAESCLSCAS